MSKSTQITINGKLYNVKAGSASTNIHELAGFVDEKIQQISQSSSKFSTIDLVILAALNIAQEVYESRKQIQSLEDSQNSFSKEDEQKIALINQLLEKELVELNNDKS